jgi:ATP-binding cassette subfamily B protein
VTQDSLRSSISIVPQDTVLFHRSIKENISYGYPDATDEEIVAAAKMARCHDFISKMKHGYDTLVGERGIKLSG